MNFKLSEDFWQTTSYIVFYYRFRRKLCSNFEIELIVMRRKIGLTLCLRDVTVLSTNITWKICFKNLRFVLVHPVKIKVVVESLFTSQQQGTGKSLYTQGAKEGVNGLSQPGNLRW